MTKKTTDAVVNASKKPTKKPANRSEPFAHAADLADAYRELRAALVALKEFQAHRFSDFQIENVTALSASSLWARADDAVEAWQRLGAAARRVHVAIHGKKDAAHWDGFVRRKVA